MKTRFPFVLLFTCSLLIATPLLNAADSVPDYGRQIAPLFRKYCGGCHNPTDREGKLSLESFADLQTGGTSGPAVLAGDAKSSRLLRMLTGQAKPVMPPEDNERPTADEVALIRVWIDAGAKGPAGAEPDRTQLVVPKVKPASGAQPITSLAWSPDGKTLAIARFGEVELRTVSPPQSIRKLTGFPGKVNGVEFSRDGQRLITASGVSGLYGQAAVWNVADGKRIRELIGHRDTLYAAVESPDGKLLATAGYDRKIQLWGEKPEPVRTLDGHNDAVYDLAFHPDGSVLASASGDQTIKLWQVATGVRLDTLSQPLKEQYVVAFTPDGKQVVAAGADNRIRVWDFVSRDKPQINPLLHARFAHEGPIVQLAFSADGKKLASVSDDRTLKLFETDRYTQVHAFPAQPDVGSALAFAPGGEKLAIGRLNGTWETYDVPELKTVVSAKPETTTKPAAILPDVPMPAAIAEAEPNNRPADAMPITIPATITGTIHKPVVMTDLAPDADLFRFTAQAGQEIVFEINAARNKSPLDSRLEVLDTSGQPVLRTLLQAVRDSYFTFRGKDSDTSDDFRVHNWQEMELNEYLYANGEVVKLWLYPRGPDSGFKVYPGEGKRHTFFDTTAGAHPLGAPCYIVRPVAPGETIVPNGLPVFPLYFDNDDESTRRLGSDSKLTFTAPSDGQYLVRVTDVRGFQGEAYQYTLTARPRRPDFKVSLTAANVTINAGSGKEFDVRAERLDDFDGPIRVDVSGLPPGFTASSPIVIEPGQLVAFGVLRAAADAAAPTPENAKQSQLKATAMIRGQEVSHDVNGFGELKLGPKPKLLVTVEPSELTIAPGQTISAKVRIERNGFDGRVQLGNAEAGRNLPHGVFVDNIGLNGLLIVEGQQERQFFITASKIAPEESRLFHIRTTDDGVQVSQPVMLHVKRP